MIKANAFVIIKQDAVKRNLASKILAKFTPSYNVIRFALKQLTEPEARDLYSVHAEQPFYDDLIAFMVDGRSIILLLHNPLLSDENAILSAREIVKEVRAEFGTSVRENCIHASDSPTSMIRESAIFFC